LLVDDKTIVQSAELAFYTEDKLYAVSDTRIPGPNTFFFLRKPSDVTLMNWTNEPIYRVNERAPIKIDSKTCIQYARFFFHFIRGQLGHFIIVEKPNEVVWLDTASEKEKDNVNKLLVPITYEGIGSDNFINLKATIVFKNALFKTNIKIAQMDMDVSDPETNIKEHFTNGMIRLTNEDLLLENLNVPIDMSPD